MDKAQAVTLVEYNIWANHNVIVKAGHLSSADFADIRWLRKRWDEELYSGIIRNRIERFGYVQLAVGQAAQPSALAGSSTHRESRHPSPQ